MSVYKRPGSKYYWTKFELNGKRIHKSTKTTNLTKARQWEAALRTQMQRVLVGLERDPMKNTSLREFRERFLDEISSRHPDRPDTQDFYERRYDELLAYEGFDCPLSAIDEERVDAFRTWKQAQISRFGRTYSTVSVNRCLATLKRALRLAYRWQMIDRVPQISLLKGERQKDTILYRESADRALAGKCPHLSAVCFFHTGHRSLHRFRQLVDVTLADRDARMPHQLLDDMRAGAGLTQPGSEGVPEGVEAQALKPQLAAGPLHLVLKGGLGDRKEGFGVAVLCGLLENAPGDADMFGWDEMARETARAYYALPPDIRAKTAITARGFGEAGAIDFFGPRYGLPAAISGHQTYWFWGPRGYTGESLLMLGESEHRVHELCRNVGVVGHISHPLSREDEHFDIYWCHPLNWDLRQIWPQAHHFD